MSALIGGLVGLGKAALIDRPREQRQRELAATQALYSPWTGITPQPIQEADPIGSAIQGAAMGQYVQGMGAKSTPKSASPYEGMSDEQILMQAKAGKGATDQAMMRGGMSGSPYDFMSEDILRRQMGL